MRNVQITALVIVVAVSYGTAPTASGQIRDERQFDALIAPAVSEPLDELGEPLDLKRIEERIRKRLNRFRRRSERSPLQSNERLVQAAADFASFMATNNVYGHQADGRQPSERVAQQGYEFCIVLENIGWSEKSTGFTAQELVRQFHRGWKESPGHRENMLDPDVTEVGIGVARSDNSGRYYAVQLFARPKSRQIKFRVENRADGVVQYSVGDQRFTLEPRYIRTHAMCRPAQVSFSRVGAPSGTQSPDQRSFQVRNGDRFVIRSLDPQLEISRSPQERPASRDERTESRERSSNP